MTLSQAAYERTEYLRLKALYEGQLDATPTFLRLVTRSARSLSARRGFSRLSESHRQPLFLPTDWRTTMTDIEGFPRLPSHKSKEVINLNGCSLSQAAEILQALVAAYGADAWLDGWETDDTSLDMDVLVLEPESDEAYQARYQSHTSNIAHRAAYERTEYLRLKAIYEDKA